MPYHEGFARYGNPATWSQLACPIRVQGLALKSWRETLALNQERTGSICRYE
jgi:hypothetical protein